jgi:hypothetical protein
MRPPGEHDFSCDARFTPASPAKLARKLWLKFKKHTLD